MKKKFKYLVICLICLLSFYYTNKIALYIKSKNPLVIAINSLKEELEVSSLNSTIIDDIYIIPGISGKKIDLDASLRNMDEKLDKDKIIYEFTKPVISIEDNKDKIIIKGNQLKNSISLILDQDNKLISYLESNNYKVSLLIKDKIDSNLELINDSLNNYDEIEQHLNSQKKNKHLYQIKNNNKIKENKYNFQVTKTINHSNISKMLNSIESGDIIKIENSLNLDELIVLLNQIKYQNLSIVPLSNLINEDN